MESKTTESGDKRFTGDSFKGILAILRQRLGIIIGFTVACAGIAAFAVFSSKLQWEAAGLIQIGRVGRQDAIASGAAGPLIEIPGQVVARASQRSFVDQLLRSVGASTDADDPVARLVRRSYRARIVPSSEVIEISVRGFSPEDAVAIVNAAAENLARVHAGLANSSIEGLRAVLTAKRSAKGQLLRDLRAVEEALQNPRLAGASAPFSQYLLLWVSKISQSDLRNLTLEIFAIEEQLGPLRTYPTALLGAPEVSDDPVSPKRVPIILLATLAGFFIGILVALFFGSVNVSKEEA